MQKWGICTKLNIVTRFPTIAKPYTVRLSPTPHPKNPHSPPPLSPTAILKIRMPFGILQPPLFFLL